MISYSSRGLKKYGKYIMQVLSPLNPNTLQPERDYLVIVKDNPFIRFRRPLSRYNPFTNTVSFLFANEERMFMTNQVDIYPFPTPNDSVPNTFVDKEDVPEFIRFIQQLDDPGFLQNVTRENEKFNFAYIINFLVQTKRNKLLEEIIRNPEISGFFTDDDFNTFIDKNDALLSSSSPIMIAILYDNKYAFDLLVTKGSAIINKQAPSGDTPIMMAINVFSWVYVVRLMNTQQVDLSIKNTNGDTALHLLAQIPIDKNLPNKEALINQMVNHPAIFNQNNKGQTPLMMALYRGNMLVVKAIFSVEIPRGMIENGDPSPMDLQDSSGGTALNYALSVGMLVNAETLLNLIDLTDLSAKTPNNTVIGYSALNDYIMTANTLNTEIVRKLIKFPDTSLWFVENDSKRCLFLYLLSIVYKDVKDIVTEVIFNPSFDVNQTTDRTKQSVLHMCVKENAYVEYIVNHPNTNVNAQDIYGATPLHYTAMTRAKDASHTNLFKILVSNPSVEVDAVDNKGETTLMKLATTNHVSQFHYFITNRKAPPNIHIRSNDGRLVDDYIQVRGNPFTENIYSKMRALLEQIRNSQK